MTYKAQADTDTGKPQASGGSGTRGAGVRAGGQIAGNLYRGTGGKFQAGPGAQLQDRLAKLRAAMPKLRAAAGRGRGKGKKGKATKPKDARTPQEKANQNRAGVAKQTGMSDLEGTIVRLGAGMDSDQEKEAHDKLIEKGLAKRLASGKVILTPAGKKWRSAADKGDADAAREALSEGEGKAKEGADKEAASQQKKAEREKAKAERATAREKRATDREKKKKAAGKAKAAAQQEREKAKQERDAARAGRTEERAQQKAEKDKAKVAEKAGKEKKKAADKAAKDKVKAAQQERQTDRGLRSLSRGGKVGEGQLLDMEDAGLIAFDKDNKPTLTAKGKKRLAARGAPKEGTAATH